MSKEKIVVLGGAGHVGLPLSIQLVNVGYDVTIFDLNVSVMEKISKGEFPFIEKFGSENLNLALATGRLKCTSEASAIASATAIISVIGTPVDDHSNPNPDSMRRTFRPLMKHFHDGQLLILRSTVYPGVTHSIEKFFIESDLAIEISNAPERILEGEAFLELPKIPQIIGARNSNTHQRVSEIFNKFAPSIVLCSPEEAEMAKLFSNAWRYAKFAIANELFMIAKSAGLDFGRVREIMKFDYERSSDIPLPGFTAGPCLPKDTIQLSTYVHSDFKIGQASLSINEGMPAFVIQQIEKKYPISTMSVGVYGMGFKFGSDDIRDSLSYKLRKILQFKAKEVHCCDPLVMDDRLIGPIELINSVDLILLTNTSKNEFIEQYKEVLQNRQNLVIINIWDF
jgi:UDP-N-acetyl-D-mannosaminuronic acid dehydrogenase